MQDRVNVLTLLLQEAKQILEKMLQKERTIYKEHHAETEGNSYYVCDLYEPFGELKDLRVPRI